MSASAFSKSAAPPAAKTILLSGLIAGILDMTGALVVYVLIMQKVTTLQILKGIYAGVFGKTIIGSNLTMALIGLLFHFVIAFCFAIAYFIIFPYINFLSKHKIVSGLLYGLFVWAVMNLIVVPSSNAYHAPFKWDSALRAAIILMFCIGLPISLITAKYYKEKTRRNRYN